MVRSMFTAAKQGSLTEYTYAYATDDVCDVRSYRVSYDEWEIHVQFSSSVEEWFTLKF